MTEHAKIAVITGGSRGLGRNTALNLARAWRGRGLHLSPEPGRGRGGRFLIEAQRGPRRRVAARRWRDRDIRCFSDALKTALAGLDADRFDFLVNNAGTSSGMSFLNAEEEEFDALYRVHVKGPFFLTLKLLPLMNDGGAS